MGENIHAERRVDGDASTLTALTLYTSGGVTARTLGSTEVFHILGGQIATEDAADVALVADSEATAGETLIDVKTAAGVPIEVFPYVCAPGVVPKFKGAGANRSMCVLYGFIAPA